MSGGHFEYNNYILDRIADDIEVIVDNNDVENDYGYKTDYPPEIIEIFRLATMDLRRLSKNVHHIDYLISGDYGEDTFMRKMKELDSD